MTIKKSNFFFFLIFILMLLRISRGWKDILISKVFYELHSCYAEQSVGWKTGSRRARSALCRKTFFLYLMESTIGSKFVCCVWGSFKWRLITKMHRWKYPKRQCQFQRVHMETGPQEPSLRLSNYKNSRIYSCGHLQWRVFVYIEDYECSRDSHRAQQ